MNVGLASHERSFSFAAAIGAIGHKPPFNVEGVAYIIISITAPAGAVAGWDLHPLGSAALSRRTPASVIHSDRGRRYATRSFTDGEKGMNWDAIGAGAEVVGAIAIVVTLLYLAIQVRVGGVTAKLQAVQANREQRIAMYLSERDSPYIPIIRAKIESGEELARDEEIRLARHVTAMWAITYSDWVQNDLGLAGEYATHDDAWMATILSYPYVMKWWNDYGPNVYPPKFVSYIEYKRKHGTAT